MADFYLFSDVSNTEIQNIAEFLYFLQENSRLHVDGGAMFTIVLYRRV